MAIEEKVGELRFLLESEKAGIISPKTTEAIYGETISTHSLILWLAPWPVRTDKTIKEFSLSILKDRRGIDVTRAIIAAAKEDKDPSVRESALKALEKRLAGENFEGDERSAIRKTIIKVSQTDPYRSVRTAGLRILTKKGGEDFTKAIMDILQKEKDSALLEIAAKALAEDFARYDEIFLIGEAKRGNCDKVKLFAIEELGKRSGPDIPEALMEIAVEDISPEVREKALKTLKSRQDGKEIIKKRLALNLLNFDESKQSNRSAVKT